MSCFQSQYSLYVFIMCVCELFVLVSEEGRKKNAKISVCFVILVWRNDRWSWISQYKWDCLHNSREVSNFVVVSTLCLFILEINNIVPKKNVWLLLSIFQMVKWVFFFWIFYDFKLTLWLWLCLCEICERNTDP